MKIVTNRCFGGFSLSPVAMRAYLNVKGIPFDEHPGPFDRPNSPAPFFHQKGTEKVISYHDFLRDDPDLVSVVERLGKDANGPGASLKVIEVPDDVDWEIVEYDGMEHIAERHRTWN